MDQKGLPASSEGNGKATGTDAVLRASATPGETISPQRASVTSPDQSGGNSVSCPTDTIRTRREQIWSPPLHQADLNEACRHFAVGPNCDFA